MSNVTLQEIDNELERAQTLKETAEEFVDIAEGINYTARIRLEEERGIDIDSKRWVSLEDIPLGEEALRVKDDQPNIDSAIQILEDLVEGKIPATEVDEKFREALEDLNSAEDTLEDVGAEEVIKTYQEPDDDDFYQVDDIEQDDAEYDEGEDD